MTNTVPGGGRGKRAQSGLSSYQKMSDTSSRDDMVEKHLPLVSYIASRLAIGLPDWIDKRDLVNAGVIGLIDAVNHFDPSKGFKFETYAKTRIRGSIIDELRQLDWIPRSTRTKSREIERAIEKLSKIHGRFPRDEEVADELDWSLEKYHKALGQVSVTTLMSLDEMIGSTTNGAPVTRLDLISDGSESTLDKLTKKELLDTVVDILGKLTEQERLVIALYYYEELTLKEIGMVIEVTESRISQIHTAAVLKLRSKLRTAYNER